jgi:hypothetical protein
MCSMVCTEVPNQIKFVSRLHPTGSCTDFIYTDFGENCGGGGLIPVVFQIFPTIIYLNGDAVDITMTSQVEAV